MVWGHLLLCRDIYNEVHVNGLWQPVAQIQLELHVGLFHKNAINLVEMKSPWNKFLIYMELSIIMLINLYSFTKKHNLHTFFYDQRSGSLVFSFSIANFYF